MLIFFIHGVATKNSDYAEPLKQNIKKEFKQQGISSPHFCSSFWGNTLSDIEKIWNQIDRSLDNIERENPGKNIQDCLRYRKFREGFLSEFIGDMFTYLNEKRGYEIREEITRKLNKFIKDNPEEKELHIISHSLGTVILWDMLFSERFEPEDPSCYIRSLINNFNQDSPPKQVHLKTIITMGSPILFFNTMLGVKKSKLKAFFQSDRTNSLKWMNIIHPSDIIAYPLECSCGLDKSQIQDVYYLDSFFDT